MFVKLVIRTPKKYDLKTIMFTQKRKNYDVSDEPVGDT